MQNHRLRVIYGETPRGESAESQSGKQVGGPTGHSFKTQ